MITNKDVFVALEKFAPLPLQESYDNAGLQVGLTEAETSGVLLCLDVTEAIIAEAEHQGCNLVVSHHPLLFKGLKCVSNETMVQRCLCSAIRKGITIYAAHTNLDNAPGGVNAEMASRIGLKNTRVLEPLPTSLAGEACGSGLIGELPQAEKSEDFLKRIKKVFNAEILMHNAFLERPIQRVALCGGAGDFLLERAISEGADAFLTGEMHYHVYFGHEQQIQIGVFGHYESEQYTEVLLQRILHEALPDLRTVITNQSTNPVQYL